MDLLPTRDKVTKVKENQHHLKCISPFKKITLPSINLTIAIPVNPLLGCISSLLSNSNLMTSENSMSTILQMFLHLETNILKSIQGYCICHTKTI